MYTLIYKILPFCKLRQLQEAVFSGAKNILRIYPWNLWIKARKRVDDKLNGKKQNKDAVEKRSDSVLSNSFMEVMDDDSCNDSQSETEHN